MLREWIRSALAEKRCEECHSAKEESRGLCMLLGITPQASLKQTLILCRQKVAGMQMDLGNLRSDMRDLRKQKESRAAMIDMLTKKIVAARTLLTKGPPDLLGAVDALDANDEEIGR